MGDRVRGRTLGVLLAVAMTPADAGDSLVDHARSWRQIRGDGSEFVPIPAVELRRYLPAGADRSALAAQLREEGMNCRPEAHPLDPALRILTCTAELPRSHAPDDVFWVKLVSRGEMVVDVLGGLYYRRR